MIQHGDTEWVHLPESRSIRAGLALFAIGLVFVAVDVLPFFDGVHNRPLWLNLACLLAPLGLAIAVGSGIHAGWAEQHAAWHDTVD
jgi:uncharacterized membrane protein YhdT